MKFNVRLSSKGKWYVMVVHQKLHNDFFEEFEVSYHSQKIVLKSNRPGLLKQKSKKRIKWQVLGISFIIVDKQAAAEFILNLCDEIEKILNAEITS